MPPICSGFMNKNACPIRIAIISIKPKRLNSNTLNAYFFAVISSRGETPIAL